MAMSEGVKKKKQAEIKDILEALQPNTYTLASGAVKEIAEGLLKCSFGVLNNLALYCKSQKQKKPVTVEVNPSNLNLHLDRPNPANVTDQIKNLLIPLAEGLVHEWQDGDLAGVKRHDKAIRRVLRNARDLSKKQLYDMLR